METRATSSDFSREKQKRMAEIANECLIESLARFDNALARLEEALKPFMKEDAPKPTRVTWECPECGAICLVKDKPNHQKHCVDCGDASGDNGMCTKCAYLLFKV